ncbi:MAG TPA: condensation domain-containing protein, partial [Blastocatellia bacterium]|nr:condensation domain-containing protein [Blastocatellia bacterium]
MSNKTYMFPSSFAQRRLWFLDQLEPNGSTYNMAAAAALTGPLNLTALRQTLNEIVRRHESLRTTFAEVEGLPFQVVSESLNLELPVSDLRQVSEGEKKAVAISRVVQEARRPFDLSRGPLLRASLVRLAEQEHILVVTMHHIISDGWSLKIFTREMSILYEAFSKGNPTPLDDLPIQYADYAVWQQEWLQGEVLEEQLGYWKKQLQGDLPVLQLPTDRPRPAVMTYRGTRRFFSLPGPLAAAFKELSRNQGATVFMSLLAAFNVLLYRYSGQEDITVGVPIANRNQDEIEDLIGFFANTLVMRTDLSGRPGFACLTQRVRQMALGAYAHQDLPFEKLVEEIQPDRDMSRSPLFQVMLAPEGNQIPDLKLSGITVSPLDIELEVSNADLTLYVEEGEKSLGGAIQYNTVLFEDTTIARMLAHFQTLIESVVADPERPISALAMLTGAERHQLLF